MNLTKSGKFLRLSNAAAAATTEISGTAVDMQGFKGLTLVVAMGAITTGAVTTLKAQQSSDDGSADAYSDIEGTSVTIADTDDNKLILLEINEPQKRYVKPIITRGTQNAVVDGVFGIQTGAKLEPVTQSTTYVASTEYHHAPAEGTA